MLDDIRMATRLARDLQTFLGRDHTAEESPRLLKAQLARRDESFLEIVRRAVFGYPRSPYLALMRHAGVELADVSAWVRRDGVEAALDRLHRAGVYVTLDEFKGLRPIRRDGLELAVRARDFDNPLLVAHYEARTGGTRSGRGVGRRLLVDLDALAHESAYDFVFLSALDALDRPMALWRPVPPAGAGIKILLRHARIGVVAERWFSQAPLRMRGRNLRYWALTRYVVGFGRVRGRPLPTPEHTPLEQAVLVARWLAGRRAKGGGAYLEANAGAAVRVCVAAKERGLDISGTLFRIGGEAFTETRARIFAEAGTRAFSHYNMGEAGRLGVACVRPEAVDDVHVAMDKVAFVQRERRVGREGTAVDALFCSTLHPSAPKVMLNVETGDYGVTTERACGCPLGELGFRQHLQGIRSYEKLTSEGMQFTGAELLRLVDEILPERFGGHPTDYQLVEDEEDGLAKVSLLISPRVGAMDEALVVSTILQILGKATPGRDGVSGHRLMADYWRDAHTLRVIRREPYATTGAKILPLHVIVKGAGAASAGPPA